jgi:hypothetical protein
MNTLVIDASSFNEELRSNVKYKIHMRQVKFPM